MKKKIVILLLIFSQFLFCSNKNYDIVKENDKLQITLKMKLEQINNYWYFTNNKYKYKIKLKNSNTWINAYFNKYNGLIYYSKPHKSSLIKNKSLVCQRPGSFLFSKNDDYCKKWFYFLPRKYLKSHTFIEESYWIKDLRFTRDKINILAFYDKVNWDGGADEWHYYKYEEKNPEYDGKENNYFLIKKTINLQNIFISLKSKRKNILYKSISKKQKIRYIKKSNKEPVLIFNIKNIKNLYPFIRYKEVEFYIKYTYDQVKYEKKILNFSQSNKIIYWKIKRENWNKKNKSLYFNIYFRYKKYNQKKIIPLRFNKLYFFTSNNLVVFQYDYQKLHQKLKITFLNKENKEYKKIIKKKRKNIFNYFFFDVKEVNVILWKNKNNKYIYFNNKLLNYFKTKKTIKLKVGFNNIIKVINSYNNFLLYKIYFHKSKLELFLLNEKKLIKTKKYFRIINKKSELIKFVKYKKLKLLFTTNLKYKNYDWVINNIIINYKTSKEKDKYIKLNTFFIEKKGFYKFFLYLYNGLKIYNYFYIGENMWNPKYNKKTLNLINFYKINKIIEETNNSVTIISVFQEKENFYLNKINKFFKNLLKIKKIIITKFKYLVENETEILKKRFKKYKVKTLKNKLKWFTIDDLIFQEKKIFIKMFRKTCLQEYDNFLKKIIKKHNLEEWEQKILKKTKKEKPKTIGKFKKYNKNNSYIFFLQNEKNKIISRNNIIIILKWFGISIISFIILFVIINKLYKKYILKKNKNNLIWKF